MNRAKKTIVETIFMKLHLWHVPLISAHVCYKPQLRIYIHTTGEGTHGGKILYMDSTVQRCIRIYEQELGNFHNPYAVSIVHEGNAIVGHVPQTLSALCYFSKKKWNDFMPGNRETMLFHRFAKGGMEVPCTLTFRSNSIHQKAPEACSFSTC